MDLERIQAFKDKQTALDAQNAEKMDDAFALSSVLQSQKAIEDTIKQTLTGLVTFLSGYKPQVSVTNPQELPDIQLVIDSINQLLGTVKKNQTDFNKVTSSLDALSKSIETFTTQQEPLESVEVSNQIDYSTKFDDLKQAVDGLDVKPVVNVPKTTVNLADIPDTLKQLLEAVSKIKLPKIPAPDFTSVELAVSGVTQAINEMVFPVPNYVLPFKDSNGKGVQVQLNSDGSLPVDATLTAAFANDGTFATPARQDTGNTSLAAIKTDLDKFNFSSTPVGNESALIATVNPQSITKKTFTLNTSGDNTLYTPASGKSIKLLWYNITSSAANATSTIVILKIGTTSVDTQSLSASQPFAHTVGGGRGFYDGGANNAIIVNSSNNNTLYCNFEFLEV